MLKSKNQAGCRLPDFLIIGAMKSGTTSLSCDLTANPAIFMPSVKEPHFLCDDGVLTLKGLQHYARLFVRTVPNQICGEASTGYTKRPQMLGVPERAKKVLGSAARFVYLVRNPVDRAVSHYYHMLRAGDLSIGVDRAIRSVPELIDYGRYATQLEPWIEEFGSDRIHVVRFEDYVSDRRKIVAQISRFLGVTPDIEAIDFERVANRGADALAPKSCFKTLTNRITRSKWYKIHIHAHTSQSLRNALKPILMRKPVPRPDPPTRDTLHYLIDSVSSDAERLRELLGRPEPLWDLQFDEQNVIG